MSAHLLACPLCGAGAGGALPDAVHEAGRMGLDGGVGVERVVDVGETHRRPDGQAGVDAAAGKDFDGGEVFGRR